MIAFHERILVGSLGWTNTRLNAQTLKETQHGSREILGGPTPYPARVAVKSDAIRTTLLQQHIGHCSQGTLGIVVAGRLGSHHRRGAMIHQIEDLDQVVITK